MNSDAFVNRELSWLEFDRRVLEEAEDPTVPLLERLKFLAIVSSNLDEFFMVRVAGLKRRVRENDGTTGPDGLTAAQTLTAVAERARRLSDEQHQCFLGQLEPLLAAEGIRLLGPAELTPEQGRFLDTYFHRTVLPVVTPLAIDPGHPFPHLGNRSLCLIASPSQSSIGSSSTHVCSTSRTTTRRSIFWPPRTGCRATSTGGSKSRFPCWTRGCAPSLPRSSTYSSATP